MYAERSCTEISRQPDVEKESCRPFCPISGKPGRLRHSGGCSDGGIVCCGIRLSKSLHKEGELCYNVNTLSGRVLIRGNPYQDR